MPSSESLNPVRRLHCRRQIPRLTAISRAVNRPRKCRVKSPSKAVLWATAPRLGPSRASVRMRGIASVLRFGRRHNALHMCCGRGGGASAAAQQASSTGRARAAQTPAADSHHVLVRRLTRRRSSNRANHELPAPAQRCRRCPALPGSTGAHTPMPPRGPRRSRPDDHHASSARAARSGRAVIQAASDLQPSATTHDRSRRTWSYPGNVGQSAPPSVRCEPCALTSDKSRSTSRGPQTPQ